MVGGFVLWRQEPALADIQSALGVGRRTTGSELRSAALTLLQNGYRRNA
ncbi:hypothetical protein [Streptomyces globisporus]|nr:hypothetical protein [Streptomyces globisporus]